MSYWEILGIEPDSDPKKIKTAYAKLLKKTRPEDDPEGFTALHSAYKSALATAKRRSAAGQAHPVIEEHRPKSPIQKTDLPEADSAVVLKPEQISPNSPKPVVEVLASPESVEEQHGNENTATPGAKAAEPEQQATTPVVDVLHAPQVPNGEVQAASPVAREQEVFQQPGYQQSLGKDLSLIQAYVEELISSPRRCNKVDQWRYIETVPSMVDLYFRAQVSDWMFGVVSAANLQALQKGDLHIRQPVLSYLDEFFQWENNWQQYERGYGEQRSSAIFKFTTSNQQNNPNLKLNYFARIMAFGVDIILGGACLYVAASVPFLSFLNFAGVMYFLVAIPVLEASSLQASLGKAMFQLAVVDRNGLRLRWYHSFIRSYVSYGCIAGVKLVVWINMYTSYKYQMLLQDLITRSSVVERE